MAKTNDKAVLKFNLAFAPNEGQKRPTFKILKDKWIEDCLEKENLISEKDYEL